MRQQVNIKLPPNLLVALREHCNPYTAFIEAAIREKMQREGIVIPASDSGWRWDGDVDDMPFNLPVDETGAVTFRRSGDKVG